MQTILTSADKSELTENQEQMKGNYLIRDNYLSEFDTEEEKAYVRNNLGVPSINNIYMKDDTNKMIADFIIRYINKHLEDQEHIQWEDITNLLAEEYVRVDGETPFTKPQGGQNPTAPNHLTTKRWVEDQLKNYLTSSDKSAIIKNINTILKDYPKYEDVYSKSSVYTKDEIDSQIKGFVKNDGTTPFKQPQSGVYPKSKSHLSTKGYVDNIIQEHKEEIDPHNISEIISNKLKKYALKSSVWDKTQTYSRVQIDSIINDLVEQVVKDVFQEHTNLEDPHDVLSKVLNLGYVKDDGSTPFIAPQKGVDAINPNELVTLRQLESKVFPVEAVWKTSGPIETTVGFMEDDSEVPKHMTFQQVMDAIFYGKGVDLSVPDYAEFGEDFDINICVHGSLADIELVKLLQDGKVIESFTSEDFGDSPCITVTIPGITKDTELSVEVDYVEGTHHEASKEVTVALPIYTLLIPYWKPLAHINYEYLEDLITNDSINNTKIVKAKSLKELKQYYNFKGSEKYVPCLIIPESYPSLKTASTLSQQFDSDAFDLVIQKLDLSGNDITYKFYKYKQPLLSANLELTYNLES